MRDARLKLFFDGGCRPNPGAMESAVVTRGIAYFRHDQGHGTNTDAEWLALIHALEVAQTLGARDLVLLGDSAVVIHQAKGEWPCRSSDLQRHFGAFSALAASFDRIRIRHVARSHNLAGIALARRHAGP